jgi:hypothetical protein
VEPVRRRVALKILKLGMDTKQVVARFEAERQALALMDHPNIAKVHDAGATETGRPYFVMELVRGIKITDYCDQNSLSTEKRLDLFIQVCKAVQHAHQKGVIHRDIKPSNILVTLHDGVPVPKVIDFGIAKATTGQPLTDKTVFTAFEQFIGTPAYMSPEQAEMSGLDIDTRSDIYSLGVLLYELLTGQMPFDPRQLAASGFEEMRRIIRTEDPLRPSTRLSNLDAAKQTTVAKCRQVEAAKLIHLVRGDLDWIVMKCLEKDRSRRYDTANGLASDIQRYLSNEPVVARPPSNLYRFQKLVRRNKLAFAAAGAVAFALMLGLAGSTWMYLEERLARQAAVRAEQEQNRARAQAATEAARSQQVARFLEDMLSGVGPSVAQGSDTKLLREILGKTAERVGKDLTGQPSVEVELRGTMGRVYNALSEYGEAEKMLNTAVRLCRTLPPGNEAQLATLLDDLGMVLWREGKEADATNSITEAVALRRKRTDDHGLRALALTLNSLATVFNDADIKISEAALREALEIQQKLLDKNDPATLTTMVNLAFVLDRQQKRTEAEPMLRKVVAAAKTLPADQAPMLAIALNLLGTITQDKVEAEALLRQALEIRRKLYPKDHADLAQSLSNLGRVLLKEEDFEGAEKYLGEAVAMRRRLFPKGSRELARNLNDLGALQQQEGKLAEAEATQREALAMRRTLLGDGSLSTLASLDSLSSVLEAQGKPAEAESVSREAVAICRKLHMTKELSLPVRRLGGILLHEKKYADFAALCQEREGVDAHNMNVWAWGLATELSSELRDGAMAVRLAEAAATNTSRKDPQILDTLAAAYAEAGQFTNAVAVQKEAISLLKTEVEKQDYASRIKLYEENFAYRDHGALAQLASARLDGGKFSEAEPLARECLTLREKQIPDGWPTFNARAILGGALLGQKKYAEAEPLLLAGYNGMKQREATIPVVGRPHLKEAVQRLVQLYEATERPGQAAEWKQKLEEFDHAEARKKAPSSQR